MTSVTRGDIVWVTFPESDEVPDEVFDNPHPAIVVQNDSENERLDSTIVVPTTTSTTSESYFTSIELPAATEDVEEDCIAKPEMIATVSVPGQIMDESKDPDVWKMGELSASKMNDLEAALEVVLSLR